MNFQFILKIYIPKWNRFDIEPFIWNDNNKYQNASAFIIDSVSKFHTCFKKHIVRIKYGTPS